jgi:hypothetical protein
VEVICRWREGVLAVNPLEASHIQPHAQELVALCASKVEEFHLLGYEQVDINDLWAFVCQKVSSDMPLYQLVDFILSIRVMDFMNYKTISAYKGELG